VVGVTEGEGPGVGVTEGEGPGIGVTEGEGPGVGVTEGAGPGMGVTKVAEGDGEVTEGVEGTVAGPVSVKGEGVASGVFAGGKGVGAGGAGGGELGTVFATVITTTNAITRPIKNPMKYFQLCEDGTGTVETTEAIYYTLRTLLYRSGAFRGVMGGAGGTGEIGGAFATVIITTHPITIPNKTPMKYFQLCEDTCGNGTAGAIYYTLGTLYRGRASRGRVTVVIPYRRWETRRLSRTSAHIGNGRCWDGRRFWGRYRAHSELLGCATVLYTVSG